MRKKGVSSGATSSPFEPYVLISYSQLMDLLRAAERLQTLDKDMISLRNRQTALQGQFTELLERFKELKDFVID